ncbi:MAG: radical SAM family heme chaperone HemW [Mollicutes bacterium]|nr:radical SAM family heme chaperone HemW [Mollicutes bacterium]
MLGLYIHIPFCRHICHYCDFYKMVASDSFKSKYIKLLLEEMKIKKLSNYQFDTLYIGGGTPSALNLDDLKILFNYLDKNINLASLSEFTIEVNPEDINLDLLQLFNTYHVTRISMGIQSFKKEIIDFLGRNTYFDFNNIKTKVELIKSVGISNINCDLIYAVPNETLDDVISDVNQLLDLDITHVSTYSLILEDHTILNKWYQDKIFELTNDELDASMYEKICDKLKNHNFKHYETSNFSIEGYESKHNLIYWNNEEYIGIGAGAATHLNHERYTNIRNIEKYYDGVRNNKLELEDYEIQTLDAEMNDEVMLGLRKMEGISKTSFLKKYKIDLLVKFPIIIELIREGLLEETNGYIRIPSRYSYIANYIIIKII